MKKIFIILYIFLFSISVFSLEIPSWVNFGLSNNEVKELLGIWNPPNEELPSRFFRFGDGLLGFGRWDMINDYLLIYTPVEGIYNLSQYLRLTEGGRILRMRNSYHFRFNTQNKLISFWFIGAYSYQSLFNSFSQKYGPAQTLAGNSFNINHFRNVDVVEYLILNNYFYRGHEFLYNLPQNVMKIQIFQLTRYHAPHIVYIHYQLNPN